MKLVVKKSFRLKTVKFFNRFHLIRQAGSDTSAFPALFQVPYDFLVSTKARQAAVFSPIPYIARRGPIGFFLCYKARKLTARVIFSPPEIP